MANTTTCDICKEPVAEVFYRLEARAADDPEQRITKGPDMHWACIADYIRLNLNAVKWATLTQDEDTGIVTVTFPPNLIDGRGDTHIVRYNPRTGASDRVSPEPKRET